MAEEASSVPNNKKSNNILYAIPCDFRSKSLSAIDRKRASRMSRAYHMIISSIFHSSLQVATTEYSSLRPIPPFHKFLQQTLILHTYSRINSASRKARRKKAGEVLSLLSLLA